MTSAGTLAERLLERDAEMARIGRALARARDGSGSLVVVEGPAGIGKSSLLAWLRSAAAVDGGRVLHARGGALERGFPYGVVRQLFEPTLAAAGDDARAELLQGPAGLAGRLLALPVAGGDESADGDGAVDPSFAILHGLYWLAANLATANGGWLCIVVDDAHWADPPSARYLTFLQPRLEELPLALVVASRPDEPGAPAAQLSALATDPAAELIRLGPLSPDAVGRLVEHDAAPEFVAACHHATGGNPFLLRELTDGLRQDGIEPTAEAAARVESLGAPTVARWLQMRLGRLDGAAAELAKAVAVLETAEVRDAAALAGLTETDAARAADTLTAAGVLAPERPLAFAHPLVRTGVYRELPGARRREAHRRAAALLAERGAAQERVAEHLLASEPRGDAWVVETLAAAADTAAHRGAADSAAACLRRALEEPPAPAARSGLLLGLGAAEANLGQDDAIAHLEQAVQAAEDPGTRIGATIALAGTLMNHARYGEAVDTLETAAAQSGAEALGVLAAGIAVHHVSTAGTHRARILATRRLANEDPEPSRELLGVAGFIAVFENEPAEVAAGLARRALASHAGEPPEPTDLPWFNQAGITLLWTERYGEAIAVLDRAIERARARGDAGLFSGALAYRGWIALRRGDLAAAEADSRTALDANDLPVPAIYHALNSGVLVEALLERGALAEAEALLEPLKAAAEEQAGPNAWVRLVRGRVRLATNRAAEALEDFLAVGAVCAGIHARSASVLPWRSQAALACLRLGDTTRARDLAEEELGLAREFGAPRALGVALRTVGLAHGAEAQLREAVALLGTTEARLEHAVALAELGAWLRRNGRRRAATEPLAEAVALARACRADPLAARARDELEAAGAAPRRDPMESRSRLTASELRVARLAADGHTNREIAQSLFLTEKTIEVHLTSCYRKLDIGSRSQLPRALQAEAVAA